MQANNTPALGNAESTRTIEGGTPSDESFLTVEKSTPNVDNMDNLSEASGQHLPGASFGSTPIAVSTYMSHPPRCVTTTGTPKDIREDNL